jgi:hypothetical protein
MKNGRIFHLFEVINIFYEFDLFLGSYSKGYQAFYLAHYIATAFI